MLGSNEGPEVLTKPPDMRIAILIISLPNALSRRQVVKQYLSKIDLPWSFFEGTRYVAGSLESDDLMKLKQIGCRKRRVFS